jgi:HK97 family phage major capsid protein
MTIEALEARKAAIAVEVDQEGADLDALQAEARAINEELEARKAAETKRAEIREAVATGAGQVTAHVAQVTESAEERRAREFVETGRMEMRALLSTGNIAKPQNVGGISSLAEVGSGIVDDVHAVALTGTGSWQVAYKKTDAEAANVTDGQAVAGTASTYDIVTINPAEWGVLDEISKQVAKLSPLDYQGAIERSALIALRAEASNKIISAILTSDLVEEVTAKALNVDYLRSLRLGFRAIEGLGDVVLYINQHDLAILGAVRGTNEKRPLYDIQFDNGSSTSGTIQEGGISVRFRVLDQLTNGVQLFGQPGAVDMPMWDNYAVETDEGGDYFKRNMIGIRGLQTANADLVAWHGMQKVTQE